MGEIEGGREREKRFEYERFHVCLNLKCLFSGSCWYYLRFTDPKNSLQAWGAKADADWMPVDLYVGGQEHAVLHLLYARFWHKVIPGA